MPLVSLPIILDFVPALALTFRTLALITPVLFVDAAWAVVVNSFIDARLNKKAKIIRVLKTKLKFLFFILKFLSLLFPHIIRILSRFLNYSRNVKNIKFLLSLAENNSVTPI